ETAAVAKTSKGRSKPDRFAPNYWTFVIPALIVIAAVIVFPWVFKLWMSVNSWTLGQSQVFAGLDNYARLVVDMRFWDSL
ncbi:sugar ABC transporter permease, partial [Rhizobium leguminosarum]